MSWLRAVSHIVPQAHAEGSICALQGSRLGNCRLSPNRMFCAAALLALAAPRRQLPGRVVLPDSGPLAVQCAVPEGRTSRLYDDSNCDGRDTLS
jgi:hypothetical protein